MTDDDREKHLQYLASKVRRVVGLVTVIVLFLLVLTIEWTRGVSAFEFVFDYSWHARRRYHDGYVILIGASSVLLLIGVYARHAMGTLVMNVLSFLVLCAKRLFRAI